MQPHIKNQQFSGLARVLSNESAPINHPDVEEDIEGEQETLPSPEQDNNKDFNNDAESSYEEKSVPGAIPSLWRETITHATKGVTDNTHHEYICLADSCITFLLDQKLITRREDFFSVKPLPHSDEMIIAWIMNSCDTIGLDGKPARGPQSTYAHAQKMRASMTHMFGRILSLGLRSWKQESLADGFFCTEGNPSIAEKVSTYMIGLRHRKVQIGKTTTSARAVTPQIMDIRKKTFDPKST